MSKLHVIGIGGTGHKLSTALVHLAASGALKGEGQSTIDAVRIVSIDADGNNGNLQEAKNAISAYKKFYNALHDETALGLVPIETTLQGAANISLLRQDMYSISDAFVIPSYAGTDIDKFIRFLYTDDELTEEFDMGFYGHTSVGTLVVKSILKNDENWKKYIEGISAGDYVVVFGSIFGGTGASAIPVVLDELKQEQTQKAFYLATVMLTPYFKSVGNIDDAGKLQPNAENFQIKAKASLYYYKAQKKYDDTDSLYIIGEPEVNFSFERAARGALSQRNKAHPIELFAATAIIDFVKEAKNRKDGKDKIENKIITAEREKQGNEYYYTWKMLNRVDSALPHNIQTLMKIAVFYNKVLYWQLQNKTAGAWQTFYDSELLRTEPDDSGVPIYKNVHEYLKLYVSWFYDIHKKNSDEVDQRTGFLKFEANRNVKLFVADNPGLFDDTEIKDSRIEKFNGLVYKDEKPKNAEKVYRDIASEKPEPVNSLKRFPLLFAKLRAIFDKEEKGLFGLGKVKIVPDDFGLPVAYFAKDIPRAVSDPHKLWSESPEQLLKGIADGLSNSTATSFTADDVSIPSPWSIFIVNELALTQKESFAQLNKSAFSQWRVLLALLVLRKLNLYEDPENKENTGLKLVELKIDAANKFVSTVTAFTPYSHVFDKPNWNQCYAVLLDGTVIAFLANNTLVCPAYSYSAEIKTKLHILAPSIIDESGKFQTPDRYFKDSSQSLNRDSKYALSLYLTELQKILRNQLTAMGKNRDGREIDGELAGMAQRFINALGTVTPNIGITLSDPGPDGVTNVYELFTKLTIDSNHPVDLPFLLIGARQQVVLLGLNVTGIDAASPQAATTHVTEGLLYSKINAGTIRNYANQKLDAYLLVHEEDLFCDSMTIFKKESTPLFHNLPNRSIFDYEVIWPISEKLLDWYSPEQLNNMLHIKSDQDKVIVAIDFKLGSKRTPYTVKKEYSIKNISDDGSRGDESGFCYIVSKDVLPLWAVWPYRKILDANKKNVWHRYNFFCREPQFNTVPILEVKPYFEDGRAVPVQERALSDPISTYSAKVSYKRYSELPLALKFSQRTETDKSAYIGTVFLAKPEENNQNRQVWNVGFDFGTTTTTAFFSAGNSVPDFIQLNTEYEWRDGQADPVKHEVKNGMMVLSSGGDDEASKRALESYFIDSQHLRQKGWSTAYEITDDDAQIADWDMFKSGRIFWHNYQVFKWVTTSANRRDKLLTNIKWDTNHNDAKRYLNQLLTHIAYKAAESGVGEINWFFSYPTSTTF